MSTTPHSTYPFLLYGGDAGTWYGAPHSFEVRFDKPLAGDVLQTVAELWAENRNSTSDEPWLFSGCFARFSVRTKALDVSLGIARQFLELVNTIVGIADVVCLAARDTGGPWTAWSVERQALPAPGPRYVRALDRSLIQWARAIDETLQVPAQSLEFERTVNRIANRDKIMALGAAADEAGLSVTEVEVGLADDPVLAPEFRSDVERPDKPVVCDSPVPLAYRAGPRGAYKRLVYLHEGDVHEVSFVFEPQVIAAHGSRAWVYAYGIHEVSFATATSTPLFEPERDDYSLWSSYTVVTDAGVFIYMSTGGRLLSFRVTDDGLEPITKMKLRNAWISPALGGRAVLACGEKGVSVYAANAGELKRVANLRGVDAMNGPDDEHQVIVKIGLCGFALEGLPALVDKKMPKAKKR